MENGRLFNFSSLQFVYHIRLLVLRPESGASLFKRITLQSGSHIVSNERTGYEDVIYGFAKQDSVVEAHTAVVTSLQDKGCRIQIVDTDMLRNMNIF